MQVRSGEFFQDLEKGENRKRKKENINNFGFPNFLVK